MCSPGSAADGLEVAEQQRDLVRAVEGVGLPQRVRPDGELPDEVAVVELVVGIGPVAPEHGRPRARSKCVDGLHRHGVDHLLVELRVALRRRPAVLREQARVVEVDRLRRRPAGVDVVEPRGTRRPGRARSSGPTEPSASPR